MDKENRGIIVLGPSATSNIMRDMLRHMAERPAMILLCPEPERAPELLPDVKGIQFLMPKK